MKKVLCSFGFGEHQKLLQASSPGFYKYSQIHKYDCFFPNNSFFSDETKQRPCSWWKIELITRLFNQYDRILWIDADVVICKYDKDIFNDFNEDSHVGMVVHEVPIGFVPNCGIWLLDKKCLSWFHKLWPLDNLPRSDGWWEQDAMLYLLGIDSSSNNIKLPDTFDIPWTQLNYLWNPHVHDHRGIPKETKFFHATMFQDRLAIMKQVINQIGL